MKLESKCGLAIDTTERSSGLQLCGKSPSASERACVEAAARAELGVESDQEWAQARANLLAYVRLLREWQHCSAELGEASASAELPNAA